MFKDKKLIIASNAEVTKAIRDGLLFYQHEIVFTCDIEIRAKIKARKITALGNLNVLCEDIECDNITCAKTLSARCINAGQAIEARYVLAKAINCDRIEALAVKSDFLGCRSHDVTTLQVVDVHVLTSVKKI